MADASVTDLVVPSSDAAAVASPGRAAALVDRCGPALAASSSVRLLRELASGEVEAEAFGRYLAVEHDFVRTAARLAGYCLWQQPDWSLAERHAQAVVDLVGPQDRYFAERKGSWPVDEATLPVVLERASCLRAAVELALDEGGYAGVVTSLAAAETLYLRWCTEAAARHVDRHPAVQEWIDLHVSDTFRAQVAFLHEVVDRLPPTVDDGRLDQWFLAMLAAEDDFHASPYLTGADAAGVAS